jgi:hypothetical protein
VAKQLTTPLHAPDIQVELVGGRAMCKYVYPNLPNFIDHTTVDNYQRRNKIMELMKAICWLAVGIAIGLILAGIIYQTTI